RHQAALAGETAATASLVTEDRAAENDATISELQANLSEKDKHVDALLSRIQELQPLEASHAELQNRFDTIEYDHGLALRKLQMAESGVAAHQAEIALLNDRLLRQKAETDRPAVVEAPKAMAAAAGVGASTASALGFYDVSEHFAVSIPAPVPGHD